MKIVQWIVQVVLALHTLMGGLWKFTNSEQTDPALRAIPHGVWLAMGGVELLCSLALVLPFFTRRGGPLAPAAAAFIATEMVLFSVVSAVSGSAALGHVAYWLVVAAVAGFVAQGTRARARLESALPPAHA